MTIPTCRSTDKLAPEIEATMKEMADRAIDRAEGGAQVKINDVTLLAALTTAIRDELRSIYIEGVKL